MEERMDHEDKLIDEKRNKLRRIIRYSVAAAAAVLLIFIIIQGYMFYSLSPKKLFAEKYTVYELAEPSGTIDSTASKIEKAYREKNYNEVVKLNRNSIQSVKDVFLTGIAFLETKDYSRAVSSFQVVIADLKNDKTELKDTAEYYLALAYLRNSDYDQAIELMNAIYNSPTHLYKDKFSHNYINRVKRLKWR
jgi:tetratricopeptide (TPR) repeat protein